MSIRTVRAGRPAPTILLLIIVVAAFAACAGSGAGALQPVGGDTAGRDVIGGPTGDGTGSDVGRPAPSAGPSSVPGNDVGAVDDARIVRTGTMELQVTDVARAVTAARDAIRGLGGYVGASDTTNQDDRPVARITYRIPVTRWEDALAALRGLNGLTTKVVTEETQAVEVTGQLIDLDARIRNLRASEAALQAIAARAGKISDVLEVQAQLTDVRGQIEQLSAQQADLGGRADDATLTATFKGVVVAVEVAQKGWDPTAIVDAATASMVGLLQSIAGAGIWIAIVWLPICIVLTALALGVAWIVRRTGILRRPPSVAPTVGPTGWGG